MLLIRKLSKCELFVFIKNVFMFLHMVVILLEMREDLLERYVVQWIFLLLKNLAYMCPKEQTLFNKLLHVFTHRCFCIENLNLNTEKSNKTSRY